MRFMGLLGYLFGNGPYSYSPNRKVRFSSRFDKYFEPRERGSIVFSPRPKSTNCAIKQARNAKKLHGHLWEKTND